MKKSFRVVAGFTVCQPEIVMGYGNIFSAGRKTKIGTFIIMSNCNGLGNVLFCCVVFFCLYIGEPKIAMFPDGAG